MTTLTKVTTAQLADRHGEAWVLAQQAKIYFAPQPQTESKSSKAPEILDVRRIWGGRPVKTLEELSQFGRGYGGHSESESEPRA